MLSPWSSARPDPVSRGMHAAIRPFGAIFGGLPQVLGLDANTGLIQQSSPIDLSLYHSDLEEISRSHLQRDQKPVLRECFPDFSTSTLVSRASTPLSLHCLIPPEHWDYLGSFVEVLVLGVTLQVLTQSIWGAPGEPVCDEGVEATYQTLQARFITDSRCKMQAQNFFEVLYLILIN